VTTFAIIITKIDQLLQTARNKLEDVNLQKLSHEEILKEVKVVTILAFVYSSTSFRLISF